MFLCRRLPVFSAPGRSGRRPSPPGAHDSESHAPRAISAESSRRAPGCCLLAFSRPSRTPSLRSPPHAARNAATSPTPPRAISAESSQRAPGADFLCSPQLLPSVAAPRCPERGHESHAATSDLCPIKSAGLGCRLLVFSATPPVAAPRHPEHDSESHAAVSDLCRIKSAGAWFPRSGVSPPVATRPSGRRPSPPRARQRVLRRRERSLPNQVSGPLSPAAGVVRNPSLRTPPLATGSAAASRPTPPRAISAESSRRALVAAFLCSPHPVAPVAAPRCPERGHESHAATSDLCPIKSAGLGCRLLVFSAIRPSGRRPSPPGARQRVPRRHERSLPNQVGGPLSPAAGVSSPVATRRSGRHPSPPGARQRVVPRRERSLPNQVGGALVPACALSTRSLRSQPLATRSTTTSPTPPRAISAQSSRRAPGCRLLVLSATRRSGRRPSPPGARQRVSRRRERSLPNQVGGRLVAAFWCLPTRRNPSLRSPPLAARSTTASLTPP